MKLGRVIQGMFYLGQVGLTRFIQYRGLTWILEWITCINIGVSDQNNELCMLDSDDGIMSPDFPQDVLENDCTIRIFQSCSAWIMQSHTPQKCRVAITIFTSLYNHLGFC